MTSLIDGVYISSVIHTEYFTAMILLAAALGVAGACFLIVAIDSLSDSLTYGVGTSWKWMLIAAAVLIAGCVSSAMEVYSHRGDVAGYSVYVTKDANVEELFSKYDVESFDGNLWTVKIRKECK